MQGKIGLGTYNLQGKECLRTVCEAVDLGYRLFDTASIYENHVSIGQALANIDRDQIQIISKIWISEEVDDGDLDGSIERACNRALKELRTDYLDIYLIHWPDHTRPLEQMLMSMEKLKEQGKIKEVGVSNFTRHHLQDIYDAGIVVSWNQVELHPFLAQKELIEFATSHGTKVMAYRPFGKGSLLKKTPLFTEIGKRYGKTGAQVVLRWLIQQELTAIPKASSREHLKENFEVFDFVLTQSEMASLDALNCDLRTCEKEFSEFDY